MNDLALAPVFTLFALFRMWLVFGLSLRCENRTAVCVFPCICQYGYHLSQFVILFIGICEFLWWCVYGIWMCIHFVFIPLQVLIIRC